MTSKDIEDRCEITAVIVEGDASEYLVVRDKMYRVSTEGDVNRFTYMNPDSSHGYMGKIKDAIQQYVAINSKLRGVKKYPLEISITYTAKR